MKFLKRYHLKNFNFILVTFVTALSIIGIMAVGSAQKSMQGKQIFGVILGLLVMLLLSLIHISGNWFSTFTIDKGSDDGLPVDMNVIAGSGLVGIITEVAPGWSRVRSIDVYKRQGQKISEHNERERQKESPYQFCYFVLNDRRECLYERIDPVSYTHLAFL